MQKSSMVGWAFLVLGFLAYSLSLWGTGFNQPRTLSDEQKSSGQIGNKDLYTTSVIFVFIGLFIYIVASLYTGAKASKALLESGACQLKSLTGSSMTMSSA